MNEKEGVKKLKTFNLDESLYKEFSAYCKKHGISMSKRIENFIRWDLNRTKNISKNNKFGKVNNVSGMSNIGDVVDKEHPLKKYC